MTSDRAAALLRHGIPSVSSAGPARRGAASP
jgi:hypothetical protein